jgi:hypothetical protein
VTNTTDGALSRKTEIVLRSSSMRAPDERGAIGATEPGGVARTGGGVGVGAGSSGAGVPVAGPEVAPGIERVILLHETAERASRRATKNLRFMTDFERTFHGGPAKASCLVLYEDDRR